MFIETTQAMKAALAREREQLKRQAEADCFLAPANPHSVASQSCEAIQAARQQLASSMNRGS